MSDSFDDPKVLKLPVSGASLPQAPTTDQDRREAIRQEILGLLGTTPSDQESEPAQAREPEWLPAPPPTTLPFPHPPPAGHPNALECPQCHRWTWCATELCLLCWYNLTAHFERIEAEKLERHRQLIREYQVRARRRLLLWSFGLLVLGVTLLSKSSHVPEPARRWMVYAAFIAIAIGAVLPRCST